MPSENTGRDDGDRQQQQQQRGQQAHPSLPEPPPLEGAPTDQQAAPVLRSPVRPPSALKKTAREADYGGPHQQRAMKGGSTGGGKQPQQGAVKWDAGSYSVFQPPPANSQTTTTTSAAATTTTTTTSSGDGSSERKKQPSAVQGRRSTHKQSVLMVDSRPGTYKNLDDLKSEKYFKRLYTQMKVEFWDRYSNPPIARESRYRFSQFNILEVLGEGSFGKVLLVEHMDEAKHYALKVMIKSFLVEQMQVRHALDERQMLHACRHPNLIHLDFVFKDNVYLFIGLPFVNGGDFFSHLLDHNVLDEPSAKFFAGQVFLAFEYLHMHNVAYRDLKPENILMEGNGYIKITDFGFAKIVPGRTWTLCGTPEYLAPEIILRKGYNKSVDWWAMGVFIYELIVGVTPFYSRDTSKMYGKICNGNITYPRRLSKSAVHLISRLLKVDVTRRIGNLFNGARDIKYHAWFNTVDWVRLYERREEPPWRPILQGPLDTHYFETFPFDGLEVSPFDQYAVEFEDF